MKVLFRMYTKIRRQFLNSNIFDSEGNRNSEVNFFTYKSQLNYMIWDEYSRYIRNNSFSDGSAEYTAANFKKSDTYKLQYVATIDDENATDNDIKGTYDLFENFFDFMLDTKRDLSRFHDINPLKRNTPSSTNIFSKEESLLLKKITNTVIPNFSGSNDDSEYPSRLYKSGNEENKNEIGVRNSVGLVEGFDSHSGNILDFRETDRTTKHEVYKLEGETLVFKPGDKYIRIPNTMTSKEEEDLKIKFSNIQNNKELLKKVYDMILDDTGDSVFLVRDFILDYEHLYDHYPPRLKRHGGLNTYHDDVWCKFEISKIEERREANSITKGVQKTKYVQVPGSYKGYDLERMFGEGGTYISEFVIPVRKECFDLYQNVVNIPLVVNPKTNILRGNFGLNKPHYLRNTISAKLPDNKGMENAPKVRKCLLHTSKFRKSIRIGERFWERMKNPKTFFEWKNGEIKEVIGFDLEEFKKYINDYGVFISADDGDTWLADDADTPFVDTGYYETYVKNFYNYNTRESLYGKDLLSPEVMFNFDKEIYIETDYPSHTSNLELKTDLRRDSDEKNSFINRDLYMLNPAYNFGIEGIGDYTETNLPSGVNLDTYKAKIKAHLDKINAYVGNNGMRPFDIQHNPIDVQGNRRYIPVLRNPYGEYKNHSGRPENYTLRKNRPFVEYLLNNHFIEQQFLLQDYAYINTDLQDTDEAYRYIENTPITFTVSVKKGQYNKHGLFNFHEFFNFSPFRTKCITEHFISKRNAVYYGTWNVSGITSYREYFVDLNKRGLSREKNFFTYTDKNIQVDGVKVRVHQNKTNRKLPGTEYMNNMSNIITDLSGRGNVITDIIYQTINDNLYTGDGSNLTLSNDREDLLFENDIIGRTPDPRRMHSSFLRKVHNFYDTMVPYGKMRDNDTHKEWENVLAGSGPTYDTIATNLHTERKQKLEEYGINTSTGLIDVSRLLDGDPSYHDRTYRKHLRARQRPVVFLNRKIGTTKFPYYKKIRGGNTDVLTNNETTTLFEVPHAVFEDGKLKVIDTKKELRDRLHQMNTNNGGLYDYYFGYRETYWSPSMTNEYNDYKYKINYLKR